MKMPAETTTQQEGVAVTGVKQSYFTYRKAKSVYDEEPDTPEKVDIDQFSGPVDEMIQPVIPPIARPANIKIAPPDQEMVLTVPKSRLEAPTPQMSTIHYKHPGCCQRVLVTTPTSDKKSSVKQEKVTDSLSVLEKKPYFFERKPVSSKVQTTASVNEAQSKQIVVKSPWNMWY